MGSQTEAKIYSKNQIDIATFLGGPLIAGYLIAENFKVFGDKVASKNTLIISLVAIFVLICGLTLLPPGKTSNISLAIIPIFAAEFVVKTYQSKKIEEYLKLGHKNASSLGVFGKTLISMLITVVLCFLAFQIKTRFDIKYNYTGYLESYCNSSYGKTSVKDTKVYVPEDASCFVFKQLQNKGYTLPQVDQVLNLEFDYQKQIGIVSNSQQVTTNSTLPYDPFPFIREHQKLGISDNQITEILNTENEYLKLIGVWKDSSK